MTARGPSALGALTQSLHNFGGAAIRLCVAVATVPLLLRYLGIADSGLWFWLQAVVGLFTVVEVALATTATVHLSREEHAAPAFTLALWSMTAMGLLLGGGLFLLARPISLLAGELTTAMRAELVAALELAALVVLARLWQQPFSALQHAKHRFGAWNLLQTAQLAATSAGVIALAMGGGTLAMLIGWQALMACVFLVAHGAVAARLWPRSLWRPVWSAKHGGDMARYAAAALLTTFGSALFAHADRLVVGPLLGPAGLGVYGSVAAVASQINTLSATAAQPLLPCASELAAEPARDADQLARLVAPPFRLSAVLALGMALGLMLVGPSVMALVVPDWATLGDDTALRWMALIYGLLSLNAAGYYILQGLGRIRLTGAVVLAAGVASLAAIAMGASLYGLRGAVVGNACYIGTVVLAAIAMRELGIPARRWLSWLLVPLAIFAAAALVVLWRAP